MKHIINLINEFIRLIKELNSNEMSLFFRIIMNTFFIFWMVVLFPVLACMVVFKGLFEKKPEEPKRIAQTLRLEHKKKDA